MAYGWATRKRKAPFRHKDDRYVQIPDRVCERGGLAKNFKEILFIWRKCRFLTPNPEIEIICEQEKKRAGITPKNLMIRRY